MDTPSSPSHHGELTCSDDQRTLEIGWNITSQADLKVSLRFGTGPTDRLPS
jgi:hypothetical protein